MTFFSIPPITTQSLKGREIAIFLSLRVAQAHSAASKGEGRRGMGYLSEQENSGFLRIKYKAGPEHHAVQGRLSQARNDKLYKIYVAVYGRVK